MISFTPLHSNRRERALKRRLDRELRRVRELGLRLGIARRSEATIRGQIADDARARAERERLAVREAFLRCRALGGAQ